MELKPNNLYWLSAMLICEAPEPELEFVQWNKGNLLILLEVTIIQEPLVEVKMYNLTMNSIGFQTFHPANCDYFLKGIEQ